MELLKDLNQNQRKTIIIITHNMRLVAEYVNRVIIMARGRKLFDGHVRNAFINKEILKEAFLKPPMVTQLAQLLNKEYGIPKNILSNDEMLSYIYKLFSTI